MNVLNLKLKDAKFDIGNYKAIVSKTVLCDLADNEGFTPNQLDVDGLVEDTTYIKWTDGDKEISNENISMDNKLKLESMVNEKTGWELTDEAKAQFINNVNEYDESSELYTDEFLESQFSGE